MIEKGITIKDPEGTFKELNANRGWEVLFQKFSNCSIAKKMLFLDDNE